MSSNAASGSSEPYASREGSPWRDHLPEGMHVLRVSGALAGRILAGLAERNIRSLTELRRVWKSPSNGSPLRFRRTTARPLTASSRWRVSFPKRSRLRCVPSAGRRAGTGVVATRAVSRGARSLRHRCRDGRVSERAVRRPAPDARGRAARHGLRHHRRYRRRPAGRRTSSTPSMHPRSIRCRIGREFAIAWMSRLRAPRSSTTRRASPRSD